MTKRLFDLLFSLGILLLLGPVMILIALWVRCGSSGPALFRQVRVGRHGCEFHILKFRTMRLDAPLTGPQITAGADPRITAAGRLLRRWKLDELPQFINVLRGDMSVVGPRPEVPKYVAMYPPAVRELVLGVRPGITDLASIEYRDESVVLGASNDPERAYIETVMPAKLALCERYVRERNFIKDLYIIWRTVVACLGR